MSRFIRLALISMLLFGLVPMMHADLLFTLDQDGCSSGCGTGPFGTVKLVQGTNSVSVTVMLAPNENFVSTGAGDALEFNVKGNPTIDTASITNGFAIGPAPNTASTFGQFLESVTCDKIGCKGGNGPTGPLSFTVELGGITVDDFVANDQGYYFAADIMGTNGKTGNVAAKAGVTVQQTPEPMTFSLLGAGLLGVGLLRRRMYSR